MGRTLVEVVSVNQNNCKVGDQGYIDGYVQGGDGRPFVFVIVGEWVELFMPYQIKVIGYKND